jgi:hypothetical protein
MWKLLVSVQNSADDILRDCCYGDTDNLALSMDNQFLSVNLPLFRRK